MGFGAMSGDVSELKEINDFKEYREAGFKDWTYEIL